MHLNRRQTQVHHCNHALSIVIKFFTFSTSPLKRNLKNNDRKQDLNVFYKVCVNRTNLKNKMAAPASDWLRHYRRLLWNRWWNSTKLERKQDLYVLYKVCGVQTDQKDKMATRPLIGWDIHDFPSETAEWNLTRFIRSKISTSSTTFVFFRVDWRNKMAAPASDWLRHFRPLLCDRWTGFNETWQEARSKRPLAHCTQVYDVWSLGLLLMY